MLHVNYLCLVPVYERVCSTDIHKLVFCQQPFQLPVGIARTDIALDIAEHAVLQRSGFLEVFLKLRLALEGNLLVDEVRLNSSPVRFTSAKRGCLVCFLQFIVAKILK